MLMALANSQNRKKRGAVIVPGAYAPGTLRLAAVSTAEREIKGDIARKKIDVV
jgi:hypothetical protein